MDVHQFFVGWNQHKIARISFDGIVWTFDYENGWMLPMSVFKEVKQARIPPFIVRLMPEGFSVDALMVNGLPADTNERLEMLNQSERYMSNVVISKNQDRIREIPIDRLHGRLSTFASDGTFNGTITGVPKFTGRHIDNIKKLVARDSMSRISGFAAKVPMHLDESGAMYPAEGAAFTHILKLPGLNGDREYVRGAIEWLALDLARAGGIKTSDCAMVQLEEGKIGFLSERFDVARDEDDYRLLFAEDFCAVMGMSAAAKYRPAIELVGKILREVSTNPEADAADFYRLVCANLFLENGDFHLKNISILKVAEPALNGFRAVRLAPAYDILCTKFFGEHPSPRDAVPVSTALTINGKEVDITMLDLEVFAEVMGIAPENAEIMARDVCVKMLDRADELRANLPPILKTQPAAEESVLVACDRLSCRIYEVFPDLAPARSASPASGKKF